MLIDMRIPEHRESGRRYRCLVDGVHRPQAFYADDEEGLAMEYVAEEPEPLGGRVNARLKFTESGELMTRELRGEVRIERIA